MAYPSTISDGSFATAQQNGPWRYSFPFADVGDMTSFTAHRNMRVEADRIKLPTSMSQKTLSRGKVYFVDVTDPTPIDKHNLVDYEETWASIPITRQEYIQVTPRISGIRAALLPSLGAVTLPPLTGTAIFEYGLSPLPVLLASYGSGLIAVANPAPSPISGMVLAENSEGFIYMGRIFGRKSVYFTPPKFSSTAA